MSYCRTKKLGNIIESHEKKLIKSNNQIRFPRNCRKSEEYPLEGKCRANDITHKCIALANGFPNKIYL